MNNQAPDYSAITVEPFKVYQFQATELSELYNNKNSFVWNPHNNHNRNASNNTFENHDK